MLPMGRPRACVLTSCLNAPTRGMRLSVYCCDCPAIALFAAETLPPLGNASISGPPVRSTGGHAFNVVPLEPRAIDYRQCRRW
jgi:hypothetical protein